MHMPWMRQEPQAAFPSSVLLAFSAIDEHASTNDFRFEETLSVFDGLTLQTLRKLSIERKASLGSHARQSGADLDALERKLEQYIGSIESYMDKVYNKMASTEKQRCVFDYNSPLSQSTQSAMYSVSLPEAEQIYALVIYAAVLRRQAARTLAALVKPPADWAEVCPEGPDMVHGASAKLLRRAAGAYAEAATRARAIADRLPSESPAELRPTMLGALEQATLAEAQAVMADRAEAKKTAPALVAALHSGAAELYESAAAALRKSSRDFPNGLSALLKRYLAIGGSLEESRARRCAALVHQTEGAAGRALALLRDADETLGKAIVVAEKETQWTEVLRQEQVKVREASVACEHERRMVTFDPIPTIPPPLPEAKTIVTALPFTATAQPEVLFY